MEESEQKFLPTSFCEVEKFDFETSIDTQSLHSGPDAIRTFKPPRKRDANVCAARVRKRPAKTLAQLPFAEGEPALVSALAEKSITTRPALIKALVASGRHEPSVITELTRLLKRQNFSRDIHNPYENTAKAIYKLAGIRASENPIVDQSDPRYLIHQKGRPSRFLDSFRVMQTYPELADAFRSKRIVTRSHLVAALIESGFSIDTACTGVKIFLSGKLWRSAGICAPTRTTVRIFSLAGLPPPLSPNSSIKNRRSKTLPFRERGRRNLQDGTSPAYAPENGTTAKSPRRTPRETTSVPKYLSINSINSKENEKAVIVKSNNTSCQRNHSDDPFTIGLLAALPKLRLHAFSLTKNRSSAEDLVQQTVLNALEAHSKRQGFTPAPDETYQQSLMRWLSTIQRNKFISNYRRNKNHFQISLVTDDNHTEGWLNHFSSRDRQDDIVEVKQVWGEIDRLTPEHRHALLRVAVHGESYEEIADNLGIAVGTAKSRVSRARSTLRSIMERREIKNLEEPVSS